MRLETIVYVCVLTGPARTPEGVAEFTTVLRRQMHILDITGVFTTFDNHGVHVAQGAPTSIDRLMRAVQAGFWQTDTQVLERTPSRIREFHRWDMLDARLFRAETEWLREQLALVSPPAEPIRALLTWAASRQIEREAENAIVNCPPARLSSLSRLH